MARTAEVFAFFAVVQMIFYKQIKILVTHRKNVCVLCKFKDTVGCYCCKMFYRKIIIQLFKFLDIEASKQLFCEMLDIELLGEVFLAPRNEITL